MKNTVFSTIAVIVLVLPSSAYCGIYEFTGGHYQYTHGGYNIHLEAYYDGNPIAIEYGGGGSNSLYPDVRKTDIRMIWDVNPIGMTTTFRQLDGLYGPAKKEATGTIKEDGFGGWEIPFTVRIDSFSTKTLAAYGPYAINPVDLTFQANEDIEIQATYSGYLKLLDEQIAFEITKTPPPFFSLSALERGRFDDSGYPEHLGLEMSSLLWYDEHRDKIYETRLENKLFELYVKDVFVDLNGLDWQGQLTPEPATAFLLGLGGLALLRKRRA